MTSGEVTECLFIKDCENETCNSSWFYWQITQLVGSVIAPHFKNRDRSGCSSGVIGKNDISCSMGISDEIHSEMTNLDFPRIARRILN